MKLHIKEARERIGMSQKDFAAILEIGASTLNGYEKGNHEPKSDILCKIAKLCNTTIDYLLGITNDPEPETPNFKTTSSEQAHIKKYRKSYPHLSLSSFPGNYIGKVPKQIQLQSSIHTYKP